MQTKDPSTELIATDLYSFLIKSGYGKELEILTEDVYLKNGKINMLKFSKLLGISSDKAKDRLAQMKEISQTGRLPSSEWFDKYNLIKHDLNIKKRMKFIEGKKASVESPIHFNDESIEIK